MIGKLRALLCLLALLLTARGPVLGQESPAQVGRWDPPRQWPIVGIHAAVLPTGEVLHLTYLEAATELRTAATVWNPATGRFRDVSPGFGDMFCSGQTFLPNGELFIAGGYAGIEAGACNARGVRPVYTFDPSSLAFRERGNLGFPRFYPTIVPLADGRQLIIGGQGSNCQYIPVMEIFDPERGLSRVAGPREVMRDYPRVFLVSDGSVVHVAPEPVSHIITSELESWKTLAVTRLNKPRFEPAAFYVPGQQDRIMVCGGYTTEIVGGDRDDPTDTCEVIDPLAPQPAWRQVASMQAPRGDLNAVLLPDGEVLIVGGGAHHRYEGPDLRPELYDPVRNSWTFMAPQTYGRMYHSTAVLLPDGRVLSAGQDDDGSEDGVVSGLWGEVFSPPYLFRGARPDIAAAPAEVAYGTSFRVSVSQTASIRNLVLMGLGTVTHSTNMGQRYVPLEFARASGSNLDVQMTANPNLAPPGYYMLFAVNDKGVPSVARMIRLSALPPGPRCFKLTLAHRGRRGGGDPIADPARSEECSGDDEYLSGTTIALTAQPSDGWEVAGWSGTDDDASALAANAVTMPAANHTVTVTYAQIKTSFSDSFEGQDLCGWTARECTACDTSSCQAATAGGESGLGASAVSRLEVSGERAHDGSHSLRSVYEAANKGKDYLVDTTPGRSGGEARYEAGFWLWPEPGLVVKGTKMLVLQAVETAEAKRTVFELFLRPVRGQQDRFALVLRGRTDGGQRVDLRPAEVDAGEWHRIGILWTAASSEGGGGIALYLDDALVAEGALANPSMRLDAVRLGQVKGKKRPTRGALFFDLFESEWAPAGGP